MDKKTIIKLLAGALFFSPVFSNASESEDKGAIPNLVRYEAENRIGLNIFMPGKEKNKPFLINNSESFVQPVPVFFKKTEVLDGAGELVNVVDLNTPIQSFVHVDDELLLEMNGVTYRLGDVVGKFGRKYSVHKLSVVSNPGEEEDLEQYAALHNNGWYYRCKQKSDGSFDWKNWTGGYFSSKTLVHTDIVFYGDIKNDSLLYFFPEAALVKFNAIDLTKTSYDKFLYEFQYETWGEIDKEIHSSKEISKRKIPILGNSGIDGTITKELVKAKTKDSYDPVEIKKPEGIPVVRTEMSYDVKGETHVFKTIHVFLDNEAIKKAEKCFNSEYQGAFLKYLAKKIKNISSDPSIFSSVIFDNFLKTSEEKKEKKEEETKKPFTKKTESKKVGTTKRRTKLQRGVYEARRFNGLSGQASRQMSSQSSRQSSRIQSGNVSDNDE